MLATLSPSITLNPYDEYRMRCGIIVTLRRSSGPIIQFASIHDISDYCNWYYSTSNISGSVAWAFFPGQPSPFDLIAQYPAKESR